MLFRLTVLGCFLSSASSAATLSLAYDPERLALAQGVYCKQETVDTLAAPNTEAGEINLFERSPDFLAETNVIPALLGIGFGIKVETLDGAFYDPVEVTVTHPPFQHTGTTTQRYMSTIGGTGGSIVAYSFDIPRELAVGTWTFTVSTMDETLYTATFEIVAPGQAPNYAALCAGDLTS
ncbi:MAG: DUF3859 domain-containing protein [Rhodobacteraceae bacterium]|nr:DUF3859 domain-containing protein [Paracoccaceae bacterium]